MDRATDGRDEARARLRARIRQKQATRRRGDDDAPMGGSCTPTGATGGLQDALMRLAGDDPETLRFVHQAMRDPRGVVESLRGGARPSSAHPPRTVSRGDDGVDGEEEEEEGLPESLMSDASRPP